MSSKESTKPTKRSTLASVVDQGTMMLMFAIGGLILLLAMLILFHQNANATKGYLLRNLERDRTKLLSKEEVLNMELSIEQSLRTIEQDSRVQAMTFPTEVQYSH